MTLDEAREKLDNFVKELHAGGWTLTRYTGGIRIEPIRKSIPDPEPSGPIPERPPTQVSSSCCPTCGGVDVIKGGNCETCVNCGTSIGGCT